MGHAIPRQHPAVVLRSHFDRLRALLAVAMIAVAGLTVAVVILAEDGDQVVSTAKPIESTRYDEGTRGPLPAQLPNTRSDEGTRGPLPAQLPNIRYDGGPEEGTAGVTQSQPRVSQQQAFPGLPRGTTGDYAHGPLSPAAPAKDYGMNGSTGDFATEAEAKAGSRPDGGPEEGSHLSGPRP